MNDLSETESGSTKDDGVLRDARGRVRLDAQNLVIYVNRETDRWANPQLWYFWPTENRRHVSAPHDFVMKKENCDMIARLLRESGDISVSGGKSMENNEVSPIDGR